MLKMKLADDRWGFLVTGNNSDFWTAVFLFTITMTVSHVQPLPMVLQDGKLTLHFNSSHAE